MVGLGNVENNSLTGKVLDVSGGPKYCTGKIAAKVGLFRLATKSLSEEASKVSSGDGKVSMVEAATRLLVPFRDAARLRETLGATTRLRTTLALDTPPP